MTPSCPQGCKDMTYQGIRGLGTKPVELWECPVCGRREARPYSGTMDTIEWRD